MTLQKPADSITETVAGAGWSVGASRGLPVSVSSVYLDPFG